MELVIVDNNTCDYSLLRYIKSLSPKKDTKSQVDTNWLPPHKQKNNKDNNSNDNKNQKPL